MPDPDAATDRDLLRDAVGDAGEIARGFFRGRFKTWQKGGDGNNPVTEADIAIDDFLKRRLLAARPGYGWLSEESKDNPERLSRSRIFVLDPIDGTSAFVKGTPEFTIAAAVVDGGEPVAAVVYNPITGECFDAAKGRGARKNSTAIGVSARASLEDCRMLGWPGTFKHRRWEQYGLAPWPRMHLENRASIAYRMALVASGEFDAMVSLGEKSDWDVAAGDLLVREAGGRVSAYNGAPFVYNRKDVLQHSVICAGAALHDMLVARTRVLAFPDRRSHA